MGRDAEREEPGRLARLAEEGQERLGALGRDVAGRADATLEELREQARELRHRLAALERRVERDVRRHPGPWIAGGLALLALGVGLGTAAARRD